MTTSDYKKMFAQLDAKESKKKKYERNNAPKKRSCGINLKKCRRCGRPRAHIGKYGIGLCRQCFREIATQLGFKKYS